MENSTNSEPTPTQPSKEENAVLSAILQMQEVQSQALNKVVKDIEILKDAYRLPRTLDKITTQGIVLIILVLIVGLSFVAALFMGGVAMAISVFQALSLFETIIAVYFGLSFNLKNGGTISQEVIDNLNNAISTFIQKAS